MVCFVCVRMCVCRGAGGLPVRGTWIIGVLGREILRFLAIPLGNPPFLFVSKQILEIVCCVLGGEGDWLAVWKTWIIVLGKYAVLWASHSGNPPYLCTTKQILLTGCDIFEVTLFWFKIYYSLLTKLLLFYAKHVLYFERIWPSVRWDYHLSSH